MGHLHLLVIAGFTELAIHTYTPPFRQSDHGGGPQPQTFHQTLEKKKKKTEKNLQIVNNV